MQSFFRRPWIIVAVIALITLFFAAQLPKAELDNNNFRFIPVNDPARILSQRIDDTFGSQVTILLGLERRHGSVLDAEFLSLLRGYIDTIERIPVVDTVESIIGSDFIHGVDEAIVVEPLVPEDFSGTPRELADLKDRLLSWDLYRRVLISDDFSATQVIVSLNILSDDAGRPEALDAYREIRRLAHEAGFPDTSVYITGLPVFSGEINEATLHDLRLLVPLVVIVVLGVLFFSFRRAGGVVLPMLTVLVSTIWAVGAMPLLGVRLSILSTVLPVILVAVGSAYGIHLISHYYDEVAGRRTHSKEEYRSLVFALLRRVGRPVILAALTTFVGFVSFCFTPVVPIFEFGAFASFGVFAAMVNAVTLIPALLLIRGPAARSDLAETEKPRQQDPLSAAIADSLLAVSRKQRSVIFLAAVVVLVSIAGLSRIVIDNVLVEYFKPDTEIARSDRFIREHFGGSKSVSVVVSSDEPGGVLHPHVLLAMDGLATYLEHEVPEVGKAVGFHDLIKRINQVINAGESPEGLAPVRASVEPTDFGFGFGAAVETSPPVGQPAPDLGFGVDEPGEEAEKLDETAMAMLLQRALSGAGRYGVSAEELVRSLFREVNFRGFAYYEIPASPERYGKTSMEELKSLISNYLILLAADTSAYADDPLEPRSIRLSVQLRTTGQLDSDRAVTAIRDYVAAHFPPDVQVEIGGPVLVEGALNALVVQSQLISVLVSLVLVFLILTFYYRSPMAGLIGMAPLSVSILINFAVMGFSGIKLNIGTALVASVAVGIGIDYTIHYLAAYHHEYMQSGGGGQFLRRTFLSSGKAILFNAVSVGAGFAVLALSSFNILAEFGILIAVTMATSALASITLLPVLLSRLNPAFIRRHLPSDTPNTTEVMS